MALKIFLTGDNHIGKKWNSNSYSENLKKELREARINNLMQLINFANDQQCDLFVIAGDLFDQVKVAKREIDAVGKILKEFSGTVLVMPGNHDYYDGQGKLWEDFQKVKGDNTLLLNKWQPYYLDDLDVVVYPAYCHQKHCQHHLLDWIKREEKGVLHIGIGHGALQNLSPDLDNRYFQMTERELEKTGLDLWLLGHTHIPYPGEKEVQNQKIFNAGTPEPDGLDCKHPGYAWLITVEEDKEVSGKLIETGIYKFYDLEKEIQHEFDLEKLVEELLQNNPERKIVRLKLAGRVTRELLDKILVDLKEVEEQLAALEIDNSLKLKITEEDIQKEFSENSFPYKILKTILEEDEDALQLAYELIRGCKYEN
ncbi:DNA repair exonuclease SbcCD nuclease subunit [Anaerobranca californiensis DSM 14826]|jgi:DNA repair exonuclease SbcCD nuclease subunit|uniref:DNA repair exonuclease SbcCD nuclease subunit n=1 Tax=Anaerobranca californiensis DSM 14826 TaxID=1120989 RepID=A0A1M6LKA6_9FIRM|nr:metallophosphoesterase [Anaerobranca californiensis]SHJ71568.1 DNA repair exonuclease SbcCD nuclease subunit [Anaerobranca californiensis DSM 14826]